MFDTTVSGGVTKFFNGVTRTLVLSGVATLAEYRLMVRSLTYRNLDLDLSSTSDETFRFQVRYPIYVSNQCTVEYEYDYSSRRYAGVFCSRNYQVYSVAGGVQVYSVSIAPAASCYTCYQNYELDSTFQSAYLNNGQTNNNCDLVT